MLPQSEHFVTLLDLTAVDNIVLNLYSFNIVLFDLVFFFLQPKALSCITCVPHSCLCRVLASFYFAGFSDQFQILPSFVLLCSGCFAVSEVCFSSFNIFALKSSLPQISIQVMRSHQQCLQRNDVCSLKHVWKKRKKASFQV